MLTKRHLSIVAVALLVSATAIGGAVAAPTVSSEHTESTAYAGTHVAFDATAHALANYTVDGATLVEAVQVESASEAEHRGVIGTGIGLETATSLNAAAISLEAESDTRVTLASESGARLRAYDSQRGHLLVEGGEGGTLMTANLSSDAEAEQASDARVVVTHANGTQGTFILIGDGEVTVNEDGNVTAEVGQDAKLTYQQYDGERSEADKDREAMIANGTAAAEVYVTAAADGSGEVAADVVSYAEDTTVAVTSYSENRIEMTAERTESEGRVIVTTVSEEAFAVAENLQVQVDGEAAANVESTSELVAAADDGDNSAYMVRQSSAAEASTDVFVAVNHFSERNVTMSSDDGTDSSSPSDSDTGDGTDSTDSGNGEDSDDGDASPLPGFGIGVALVALFTSGWIARRKMP